ncbi:MAG: GIY-YIG nuclease family protein [Bacteroidales bacterium]|nr:GIY-YIG nuclease family protein [Bacteroidales bacterium]MBK9357134.1 GIY-YIG nuclease family protein [Bacteroidales bacterium]
MYYIYILHSESSGSYYTGYTDKVERRVWEHNHSPHNTYTSKHRPWKLIAAFIASDDMGIAMKAERFIKKQKSKAFIQKICSMEKIDLPMAQLVKVPYLRD